MTTEPMIRIPEEAFNKICSRLRWLEAMADVSDNAPDDLAVGTVQACREGVYFGLAEVREMLIAAISKETR